nr:hypothetical protein [Halorubrum tropicale]
MLTPDRDEYFTRYDESFSGLLPEAKQARQEKLLEQESISKGWKRYKHEIEIVTEYFHKSVDYRMQQPTIAGKQQGTENDLSALFLERVFQLSKAGGYTAQVLPGAIFNGVSTRDLRMELLDETTIQSLVTFENRGIFEEIDTRYNFGVIAFKNEGRTEELKATFQQTDVGVLENLEESALTISRRVLREYSPEARIFPYVQSQQEVDVLDSILAHEPIGDNSSDSWYCTPYRELDRTNDSDRFVEDESAGDYPVYGGSNIYQFQYDPSFVDIEEPEFWSVDEDSDPDKSAKRRIKEKKVRGLKRSLYDAYDGSGSQKGFVNDLLNEHRGEPLSPDDVLLDCTEYRIVIRNIARASDERTMIASVIPPGVVCHHAINTFSRFEVDPEDDDLSKSPLHSVYKPIFSDRELFYALGAVNSIPFDFLMRTKVDSNLVMYKIEESQVPRLTEGDDWFEHIWTRAAKLNCYGDAFAEMRDRLDISAATSPDERERIQAELDAGAFHAYGLDREQTEFVLEDFYQVQNPRRMTDEYFDLVLEKYDELAP